MTVQKLHRHGFSILQTPFHCRTLHGKGFKLKKLAVVAGNEARPNGMAGRATSSKVIGENKCLRRSEWLSRISYADFAY
jgi:hypothetical protein